MYLLQIWFCLAGHAAIGAPAVFICVWMITCLLAVRADAFHPTGRMLALLVALLADAVVPDTVVPVVLTGNGAIGAITPFIRVRAGGTALSAEAIPIGVSALGTALGAFAVVSP